MNDNKQAAGRERNAFAEMAISAIHRAGANDTVIVIVANDHGATQQLRGPVPLRLIHAAAGLLDSAHDELPDGSDLADTVQDALTILPDRFAAEGV